MIYTVYANPGQRQAENLVAVPESVAPWALVAPPIWLIAHRLWWWLAAYCLYLLLTMAISATSYALIAVELSWLPGLYLMLEGRELYRRKLEENGMEMVDLISADSEEEAIGRHMLRENLQIATLTTTSVAIDGSATAAHPSVRQKEDSSAGIYGLFSPGET